MNEDRFGRTPEELDKARYAYAKGTLLLRAIEDELSEIAVNGLVVRRCKLERLIDQLEDIYELLGALTVWGMADDATGDPEDPALVAYRDTYSNGSPVSKV